MSCETVFCFAQCNFWSGQSKSCLLCITLAWWWPSSLQSSSCPWVQMCVFPRIALLRAPFAAVPSVVFPPIQTPPRPRTVSEHLNGKVLAQTISLAGLLAQMWILAADHFTESRLLLYWNANDNFSLLLLRFLDSAKNSVLAADLFVFLAKEGQSDLSWLPLKPNVAFYRI